MYVALFFVVGAGFSVGFWVVLGVVSRFSASGRLRRLAWAGLLGPLALTVLLTTADIRSGASWADMRTTGVFTVAAALGGLAFWFVSRAVTRRVFQQQNA